MTRSLSMLLVAYTLASFLHFSHNAIFLAEYPNLPVWFTPLKVYAAWFGVAAVGLAGYVLLRFGQAFAGLGVLAVYGALGLDGLAHYAVAPVSAHSLGMNLSIGFEVVTALALLVAVLLNFRRLPRARVERP